MVKNIVIVVMAIFIAGLMAYLLYMKSEGEKNGFIVSQTVFEKFKGKEYLESQVIDLKANNKRILDSMSVLVQNSNNDASLIQSYQHAARSFELKEQELSDKYTADIWKQINSYVSEFGKEKGYAFIFGATGDGSLMYADTTHNLTNEVVTYVNNKYAGK